MATESSVEENAIPMMFMKGLTGESLELLSNTQMRFISSMRSISDNSSGSLQKTTAELFPQTSLFGRRISEVPLIWTKLQKCFSPRNAFLAKLPASSIMLTIGTRLLKDPKH